ncbi:hypothetical protein MtrunA17_Chr3g0092271 [Medicago truncatula]|uniref:Uncharacterized protein n=1 Tax=Medicago truncatula TaxID=3880 RepID=A0A396IRH8_MEDTR|nr:hypothetical protein MtrunA17_Chr3g0092271 [Medicago truncatula]
MKISPLVELKTKVGNVILVIYEARIRTRTPTQLNFLENHKMQCNYMCRCRTRDVSDTETRLIQGVSVLHSLS